MTESLAHVERQLARIEQKIDKAIDDHETRIRRLERQLYVAGGIAVAGSTTGVVSVLNILLRGM